MQIDSFTVLLFGLFIKAVLGGLFLVFWYSSAARPGTPGGAPRSSWPASRRCCSRSRGFAADLLAIGIGNVALIAAFACCWQARAGVRPAPALWWPMLPRRRCGSRPACIPGFIENVAYRVVVSSLIVASLLVAWRRSNSGAAGTSGCRRAGR